MPDYTESQIRELIGRELRVAVSLLVLGDDMSAAAFGEDTVRWREAMYCLSEHIWGTTSKPLAARATLDAGVDKKAVEFVANWRAEPLPMPLEWCVLELMQLDWKLERLDSHWCVTVPDDTAIPLPGVDRAVAVGWSDGTDDPATAILRAACIVKLREGE